jgi:hypothetical protein
MEKTYTSLRPIAHNAAGEPLSLEAVEAIIRARTYEFVFADFRDLLGASWANNYVIIDSGTYERNAIHFASKRYLSVTDPNFEAWSIQNTKRSSEQ